MHISRGMSVSSEVHMDIEISLNDPLYLLNKAK